MKTKKTKRVVVITKLRKTKSKVVDQKQTPKKTEKALPAKNRNEKQVFFRRVQKDMEKILPNKMPWKIGIKKDIFEALKHKYTGKMSKLKAIIEIELRYKTKSLPYLEAMLNASCRYGIRLEQYPLSDEDRQYSQSRINELKNREPKKKAV